MTNGINKSYCVRLLTSDDLRVSKEGEKAFRDSVDEFALSLSKKIIQSLKDKDKKTITKEDVESCK